MNTKTLILSLGAGLILLIGAYFIMQKSAPNTTVTQTGNTESAETETEKIEPGCKEILGTQIVEMKPNVFNPETLTVQKCTEVVFENRDTKAHWPASNLHPTHGIYPEFDPQKGVDPGESWSFTFDKVGNWRYHDHLTPSVRGGITVSE